MSQQSEAHIVGPNGKHHDLSQDLTGWLTRGEVAEELSCSVSKVRTLERKGRLTPVVDREGVNRFEPNQVHVLRVQFEEGKDFFRSPSGADLEAPLGGGDNEALLAMFARVLNLVLVPRERIDGLLFRIIERQEKQIERLDAKYDAWIDAREAAKDRTHEREIAAKVVMSESARNDEIIKRVFSGVERFIGAKTGTPFLTALDVSQLTELVMLADEGGGPGSYWKPNQLAAIKAALEAKKKEAAEAAGKKPPAADASANAPVDVKPAEKGD